MLFLAFFETTPPRLEAVIARRLEWDVAAPPTLRLLGEWVQHGSSESIRGVIVLETDDPGDIQALVLHYGDSVKLDVRPAADMKTAIERARKQLGDESAPLDDAV